eukprot:scaffold1675_cov361-Prasinococcus_capsulatus_cf.AAC.6
MHSVLFDPERWICSKRRHGVDETTGDEQRRSAGQGAACDAARARAQARARPKGGARKCRARDRNAIAGALADSEQRRHERDGTCSGPLPRLRVNGRRTAPGTLNVSLTLASRQTGQLADRGISCDGRSHSSLRAGYLRRGQLPIWSRPARLTSAFTLL